MIDSKGYPGETIQNKNCEEFTCKKQNGGSFTWEFTKDVIDCKKSDRKHSIKKGCKKPNVGLQSCVSKVIFEYFFRA